MVALAEVVTIKRQHVSVPFEEVEPLVNQALQATNASVSELAATLGYSPSVLVDWRKTGKVPLRAKYALLGLLSELRVKIERPVEKQFSYADLLAILTALAKDHDPNNRGLIAHIAKEIAKYD
jgi:hypothetical protein